MANVGLPTARGIHRPRWRAYTAFVLSGGGARGALQVGALRALLEIGERPDVVVGTSIGAWNGALLAHDPTPAGVEVARLAWLTAHPNRVLLGMEPPSNSPAQALAAMRLLVAARRVARSHPSFYPDAGMRQFVDRLLDDMTFEELAIPLRIIATDITHGARTIFGSGPLAPAVLASSAIPGVFPPVRIGDTVYVDGGAVDNASVETALDLGARRIFILDVGYDEGGAGSSLWSEDPAPAKANGRATTRLTGGVHPVAAVLERTTQVVSRYQLQRALDSLPPGIELHLIRIGAETGGGALEFEKAPQWIEQGYLTTRAYLDRVRERMALAAASPA